MPEGIMDERKIQASSSLTSSASATHSPDSSKKRKHSSNCDSQQVQNANSSAKQTKKMCPSPVQTIDDNSAREEAETVIDEALYSRMLYVMGQDGLKRIFNASVIVSGLGGLGCEIAKNLVLGGVGHLLLHDQKTVSVSRDLSTHFYVTEKDEGKNRAEACKEALAQLNSYVQVKTDTKELNANVISNYDLLVLADFVPNERDLSRLCRQNGVKFISAQAFGLSGRIFVDLGPSFTVYDQDGLSPNTCIINEIHPNGHVFVFDEQRHGYDVGDHVKFSEVLGMTKLNNQEFPVVEFINHSTFSIGDLSHLEQQYESGGLVVNVKVPISLEFQDLDSQIKQPKCVEYDFAKVDTPLHLHMAYEALVKFALAHNGHLPRPYNKTDADELLGFFDSVNADLKLIDSANLKPELITKFAYTADGSLCPLNSFIGGITAQEAIKACTGKFTPIHQFFYFESFECLDGMELVEREKVEGRYSRQIQIFGQEVQNKLEEAKVFVVGAGALGCELLKNFAMMGVSAGANGKTIVTDMDLIERSNLNRQFLFGPEDIGKFKSTVAANTVRKMNPAFNIVAHQNRVGKESESNYGHWFYSSLDLVCNALDNIASRLYVDQRCVFYQKPLLESGTLGTAANSQIIVPFMTESYSSSQDPAEQSFPMCTIRNFPNTIEHTLHWARDQFEGLFANNARNAIEFLEDKDAYYEKARKSNCAVALAEIEQIRETLKRPHSFSQCVEFARNLFQQLFSNQIRQLLHTFPPDSLTNVGAPFWSGPKRCPHPLDFDPSNSTHSQFIWSAANLYAGIYGIAPSHDLHKILDLAQKCEVQQFEPKQGVKIAVTDAELDDQTVSGKPTDLRAAIYALWDEAEKINLVPMEFEKDDDTNFHMDFITSCSNLRAENYCIAPADKVKSKLIAGRIIPAIATSTSMIVGLVCLELYKLIRHSISPLKLESFRNAYINLATSHFAFCEPFYASKQKIKPSDPDDDRTFTLWDRIDVHGDMTLEAFLEYFERERKIKITMISFEVTMIYSSFLDKEKVAGRMNRKFSEIIREIRGDKFIDNTYSVVLEIFADDLADGNEMDLPFVRLIIGEKLDEQTIKRP